MVLLYSQLAFRLARQCVRVPRITCRLLSGSGNPFDYDHVYKNFEWNVPETFNFAQDVIDEHANDESRCDLTAFHHLSCNGKEIKWSFLELSTESKRYASALLSLGYIKKALIILPRVPEWWLLNLAALRTDTILIPGTSQLSYKDIDDRLRLSQADAIIADISTANKVENISGHALAKVKHRILVTSMSPDTYEVKALLNNGWLMMSDLVKNDKNPSCPDCLDTPASNVMQIFFTSGTTGSPKMCAHTHASYGYCHWVTGKYWLDLTSTDLHWNISDTGWAKSAWSNVFAPWSQAAGVFVHDMPRFEAAEVLKVLGRFPVTTLCAPPTLYRSLILEQDIDREKLKSLRHCVSAGEPLNEEVIKMWHNRTGLWIREGYGQTETTLVAANFKNMDIRLGSMGKAAPGYDVRIVNNMGVEVERGKEGNVAINCEAGKRPPGLFTGYVDNQEMTENAFLGHFYFTGDRGTMDSDGYIWFSARQDDLIISSGYRIGPFEVESALLSHPAVVESAAVSSPDVTRGRVVKAFVVLTPEYQDKIKASSDVQEGLIKELQDHVKTVTAPYKYPRKIEFLRSLPKTVSGKIRRALLREWEIRNVHSDKFYDGGD